MRSFLNPAGGLRYHARADRYRHTLWQSFVQPLGDWLDEWRPRSVDLLLVGPSGGYCLPEPFLARFRRIRAVDPDPLARRTFLRRFPTLAPRIEWTHEDFLAGPRGALDPGRLQELFDRVPGHAVLFANVLGQLDCLYPEAVGTGTSTRWAATLAGLLAERDWASFHDRLSGTGVIPVDLAPLDVPGLLDNRTLAGRVFGPIPGAPQALEEHRTAAIFPGFERVPRRILVWQIEPGFFHVVEGLRQP